MVAGADRCHASCVLGVTHCKQARAGYSPVNLAAVHRQGHAVRLCAVEWAAGDGTARKRVAIRHRTPITS
jgi:hypothetical protein